MDIKNSLLLAIRTFVIHGKDFLFITVPREVRIFLDISSDIFDAMHSGTEPADITNRVSAEKACFADETSPKSLCARVFEIFKNFITSLEKKRNEKILLTISLLDLNLMTYIDPESKNL